MKFSRTLLVLLSVLPLSGMADTNAETKIEMNYDGFFDRMKDLDEPEYQGVKLAFYYMDRESQPCPVHSAELKTKLKQQEVYILDNGEILLPYEPLLDQDKAQLVISQKDNRECGLNMRLESNQLFDATVKRDTALSLTEKFAAAFDDLGGMMSFMLPSVEGITFKFAEGVTPSLTHSELGQCAQGQCTLLKKDLAAHQGDVVFNHKPTKAVPFIQ